MRKLILLALLLFVGAAPQDKGQADPVIRKPGLSNDDKVKVKDIIKRYFKEQDQEARDKILAELEPIDYPSKNDIRTLSKTCFKWMRYGAKQTGKSPATCTDPKYKGSYIIQVPSQAKKGAKVGLFIALHGGGAGVGAGSQIQGLFGNPNPKCIAIYPTVTQKTDTAWNTEREEQYVLAIIRELKRTYNIDTNRMYMAGHSMGGFGTWSIAGRHADMFAAASAMAGGTFGPGVIPNYKNLPLWFYHSTDDAQVGAKSDIEAEKKLKALKEKYGPYEYVWKLYNNAGHGLPPGGCKPIWDWMFRKKRDPYPKHVIWQPSRAFKKLFYWIRIPTAGRYGSLIEAKFDKAKNTFTITGAPGGTWIYLSEKMVNLSKDVVVMDGESEVHKGKVAYSLIAMIDSIGRKMDPEQYFVARVKVK